jgi:hypothetical protein
MNDPNTLDLAIIRYAVVAIQWRDFSGDVPYLPSFLAGWFCRAIKASEPADLGVFRDSFRAGWKESDAQQVIAERSASQQFKSVEVV